MSSNVMSLNDLMETEVQVVITETARARDFPYVIVGPDFDLLACRRNLDESN